MYRIASILTALAMMACLSLAAAETSRVESSVRAMTGELSEAAFSLFPGQDGEPALSTSTDDYRASLIKVDSQKLSITWMGNGAGIACYIHQLNTICKDGSVSIKDLIIPKLRI